MNKQKLKIMIVVLVALSITGCGQITNEVKQTSQPNVNTTTQTENNTTDKNEESKNDIQKSKEVNNIMEKSDTTNQEKTVKQTSPLQIFLPAFTNGGDIPTKYTCDGNDINPQINISNIPTNTKSLAIIMDDPDAPAGTWVHWVLFNIDPSTSMINENSFPNNSIQGKNSWPKTAYGGPCPPSGTHRYYFKLYALDTKLNLSAGATKAELIQAMNGHIIEEVSYMGKYNKK